MGILQLLNRKTENQMVIAIVLVTLINAIKAFQGFTHVDEPNLVFDIFRFLQNLAGERHLVDLIWPDTGMNGPLGIWIYSPVLVVFSYLLKMPIDMALRGLTLICVPFTGWFLFRAFRNMWGERAAFWAVLFFLVTPYFTVHNHLAMGEVWYTLGLALSLDYMSRDFRKRHLYFAFFFFGVGLAYKFTYVPLAVLPVTHVLLNWKEIKPGIRDFLLGGLLLFCGTLPLVLGLLLDGPGFLERFAQMKSYKASGVVAAAVTAWRNLSYGLGYPLMLAAAAGVLRVFLPGDEGKRKSGITALISLFVPLMFLLVTRVASFRYFYPLLIPVTMLAAGGIDWLHSVVEKQSGKLRMLGAGVFVVAVIGQGAFSFNREIIQSHGGPRDINVIVEGSSAWKSAALYTLEHSNPDDVIITVNPGSFYIFGKRPMALNPDFSSWRKVGDSQFIDYRMSGLRELPLDNQVQFIMILESTVESEIIPVQIKEQMRQVWSGGGVGVYLFGSEPVGAAEGSGSYRFDMSDIVRSFFRNGLQAPGELKIEY